MDKFCTRCYKRLKPGLETHLGICRKCRNAQKEKEEKEYV